MFNQSIASVAKTAFWKSGTAEDYTVPLRNSKRVSKPREVATRTIKDAEQSIQQVLQDENRKLNAALSEVQGSQGSMTQGQFMQVLQTEAAKLQKNLAKGKELRKESNAKIKDAERSRDREIKAKQESIQRLSVFLHLFRY